MITQSFFPVFIFHLATNASQLTIIKGNIRLIMLCVLAGVKGSDIFHLKNSSILIEDLFIYFTILKSKK